jgi:hypothetical protein
MAPKKATESANANINTLFDNFIRRDEIEPLVMHIRGIIHTSLPSPSHVYEAGAKNTSKPPKPSGKRSSNVIVSNVSIQDQYCIKDDVKLLTCRIGRDVVNVSYSCNVEVLRHAGPPPSSIPNDIKRNYYSDYNTSTVRTYIPVSHRPHIVRLLGSLIEKLTESNIEK